MFKLLSFDVYGTLMDTPPTIAKAFRVILEEAGASDVNPMQFYQCWEERNIVHYREPYRSYKAIGRLSLEESFQHFGISGGSGDLVDRYFAMFPEMQPYPDVLRTLDNLGARHRIALVSNIDDDLLQATPVPSGIDLVCTAERARGYKPDGTLFRYLIANAGVPIPEILHSGQSQHTDMVGGKPLWQQIHLRIAAGKRGGRRHRMPDWVKVRPMLRALVSGRVESGCGAVALG